MEAWDLWQNQKLNDKLKQGYIQLSTKFHRKISPIIADKLSCPLFIHLGPYYDKFEKKVFIVGQQQNGWIGDKETVGSHFSDFENYSGGVYPREHVMMETQSQWLLDHFRSKNTPFWQAVKKISKTNNGVDFLNSSFVWDDLIAVDYNNGSIGNIPDEYKETEIKKIWDYSKEKLLMELKVAQPTHIIFFTGEDENCTYDECLEYILDLQFKVKDCPPLKIIQKNNQTKALNDVKSFSYIHPANNHKIQCYRTHHPGRMRRLHLDYIIDDLASLF